MPNSRRYHNGPLGALAFFRSGRTAMLNETYAKSSTRQLAPDSRQTPPIPTSGKPQIFTLRRSSNAMSLSNATRRLLCVGSIGWARVHYTYNPPHPVSYLLHKSKSNPFFPIFYPFSWKSPRKLQVCSKIGRSRTCRTHGLPGVANRSFHFPRSNSTQSLLFIFIYFLSLILSLWFISPGSYLGFVEAGG